MSPSRQNQNQNWKSKASEWLFQQGVSTVLLIMLICIVCYATKYGLPAHLDMIQKGYERIEAKHTEQHVQQLEAFEKTTSRQSALIDALMKRNEIVFKDN